MSLPSFSEWLAKKCEDVSPSPASNPSAGGTPTPQVQQQNLQKTQQTQLNRIQSLQRIQQGLTPVFQAINTIPDAQLKQQVMGLYTPFAQGLLQVK